jgi:hypothetical protein
MTLMWGLSLSKQISQLFSVRRWLRGGFGRPFFPLRARSREQHLSPSFGALGALLYSDR